MNGNFENSDFYKQLSAEMKGFFEQLPEETKEKIRGCKNEEEVMDILQSEMIELPDEALDYVAGGKDYLFCPSESDTHHSDWGDED